MEIPICVLANGTRLETNSWSWFIHAACKGSEHAADGIGAALEALVALKKGTESGWGWDEAEIPQLLSECLGERPPIFQGFLRQLMDYGILSEDASSSEQACHPHEAYVDLWERWQAPPDELTHDAALSCFENWSLSAFTRHWEAFRWDNAQDLLALLLRILMCHVALKTKGLGIPAADPD